MERIVAAKLTSSEGFASWHHRVTNLGESNLTRRGCKVSSEVKMSPPMFCCRCEVKGGDSFGEDFNWGIIGGEK